MWHQTVFTSFGKDRIVNDSASKAEKENKRESAILDK